MSCPRIPHIKSKTIHDCHHALKTVDHKPHCYETRKNNSVDILQ